MSEPLKIQSALRRVDGRELAIRRLGMSIIEGMRCDHSVMILCPNPVAVSPRVYVPSKTQNAPGHRNLKMTTALHYCEPHQGTLKLEDLLDEKARANFESHAKRARPIDFVCDFDSAFLHYVNVFTPEYLAYLVMLDKGLREKFGGVPHVAS